MEEYHYSEMQELLIALKMSLVNPLVATETYIIHWVNIWDTLKIFSFPLNSHKVIPWPGFCVLLVLRHRILLASFIILNTTFTIMVTMTPLQTLLKQMDTPPP